MKKPPLPLKPGTRVEMKNFLLCILLVSLLLGGCTKEETAQPPIVPEIQPEAPPPEPEPEPQYPKIASWLAKKDEIIQSKKPYSLVMTAWFTPEEATQIKSQNKDALLLAGLSANWIWENEGWMEFLETIASYGSETPLEIKENMYLKTPNGERCAFGWASEEWGHEEIYSMDPRSQEWKELIVSFYKNVLDQPQHDGIIMDMVVEKQYWCPDAISDEEWLSATKEIMQEISNQNTQGKLVIFNAGLKYEDIDEYAPYMDGYVMENFLGEWGADYETGLESANSDYLIVYAVDTDDTGEKNLERMRLGLTLSLLNDNTYVAYDFGPRDHGQAWWFPEYEAELGEPLGDYYEKDGAYWRQFENGTVVSSPHTNISIVFEEEYTDASTGETSKTFSIGEGDGRIFTKE
jgi:hypothetical protein